MLSVKRVLRAALDIFLPTVGGILLAVGGGVTGETEILGEPVQKSLLLFAGGGACLVLLGTLALVDRVRLWRIQARMPGLEQRADLGRVVPLRMMRLELHELSKRARFLSNGRISLYRYEDDGFTLLARDSPRPNFGRSLGRDVLPLDGGVIARAWAHAVAEETDLPSPGPETEPPRAEWLDAQVALGIERAVAAEFTMRSQAYFAFRLASFDDRALGVLVYESSAPSADLRLGPSPGPTSLAEFDPLTKEVTPRLAELLKETLSLSRGEIREILTSELAA